MSQSFSALLSSVMLNDGFELVRIRRVTEGYILVFNLFDGLKRVRGERTMYDISSFTDADDLLRELWCTEKLLYIK